MKLSEYIDKLNKILKLYGDITCVYAKDSEGNGFDEVYYDPSVGEYDDREFTSSDGETPINSVCVN